MCPLCIGTATLLISSGTSAGGLAALVVRLRTQKHESNTPCTADRGRSEPSSAFHAVHSANCVPPNRIMSTRVE
jgi:hypothetical protein